MVDVALWFYFLATTNAPKLTNPDLVQEPINGLKFGKAPGLNGTQDRALTLLPSQRYPYLSSL
jgi:hypothetical protein